LSLIYRPTFSQAEAANDQIASEPAVQGGLRHIGKSQPDVHREPLYACDRTITLEAETADLLATMDNPAS